jgi:hypothetical protein
LASDESEGEYSIVVPFTTRERLLSAFLFLQLSSHDQQSFPKPKQVWTELDKLTVIRHFEEHKYALGDQVCIASDVSKEGAAREGANQSSSENTILQVVGLRSNVKILWQDGTNTSHDSKDLESLGLMMDQDHQAWCGDHVIYETVEGEKRGAVIQSMDVKDQTADIVFYKDMGQVKTVSVLEYTTEGGLNYEYGINRGDAVLISSKETGYFSPSVPVLGAIGARDSDGYEKLEDRLVKYGRKLGRTSPRGQVTEQVRPRLPCEADEIDWFGVVVDCKLDGSVMIELPNGQRIKENVDKLSRLFDEEDEDFEEDEVFSGMDRCNVSFLKEYGVAEQGDWEDLEDSDLDEEQEVEAFDSKDLKEEEEDEKGCALGAGVDLQGRSALKILEEAPKDHAFIDKPYSSHRTILSHIKKEYTILTSNLPGALLEWEETPYEGLTTYLNES